jgi:nondiscriminating glutamyl-tRNA synthetase
MSNEIRVRYAPSPTGHLHIGNARTALFNYLYARNTGGKFIVRIEDTDTKRNILSGEQSQLKYLKWLGIDWDESVDVGGPYSPYRQSERNHIYEEFTKKLLATGHAYKCYCTEEEIEAERAVQMEKGENPSYSGKCRHLTEAQKASCESEGRKPSIRFVVPAGKSYVFNDMIKDEVSFESDTFGDWVMVKKDGIPTYNYAVVIDDHKMEITHVLRGDDHISNTPKQMMVYEALGWEPPVFGHMTLIVNESRKKLSKRDESIIQFIEQYEELGYLPEALFNFIALLGWHPGGEEEVFTKEQFVEIFDPARLSKSPALFDRQKLTWLNNQYMKKTDIEKVIELSLPHLVKAGRVSADMTAEESEWVNKLVTIFKDYMSYGAEIVELSNLFFQDELTFDQEATEVLAGETVPTVIAAFLEEVKAMENFVSEEVQAAMKRVQKETGQKGKNLFMPVRVAIFGQVHGPDLMKSIELLGQEKVIKRLEQRLGAISNF